jgi:hypothetical protein
VAEVSPAESKSRSRRPAGALRKHRWVDDDTGARVFSAAMAGFGQDSLAM